MTGRKILYLWLALLLAFAAAGAASAQEPPPDPTPSDNEVNAIAKGLYCPVCENIPLDVCGTQACEQWRQQIREKLALGWTEQEIKDYFVRQYGDRVLAEPPRRGFNWLVYVVPPLAILAAAFLLYRAMRTWKRPLPQAAEGQGEVEMPQDEYVARLEEELDRRR